MRGNRAKGPAAIGGVLMEHLFLTLILLSAAAFPATVGAAVDTPPRTIEDLRVQIADAGRSMVRNAYSGVGDL